MHNHSSWGSSAHCTLLSGLASWWSLAPFSQCQTDTEADWVHLINHFDHWYFLTILWQLLKAKSWYTFNWNVQNHFLIFLPLICVLWVRLYLQISTAGTSLGSLVGSHTLCFLCRSVSWSDLSWSLWCSSLPILCRSPQPPHWPPCGASRSLYLNPADSNKHIHHCGLLPSRWTAVKTKTLWRSYCYNITVPDESKHLATSANIPFLELMQCRQRKTT